MLMRLIMRRLKPSLLTLPDAKGWRLCALIGGLSLVLIAAMAFCGHMIRWQPQMHNWLLRLISVMLVPALGEELVFRGLLTPGLDDTRRPVLWIALSVLMFMMWHVVEARTFLPGAQLFLRPLFLICAGILGLACALMRYRTGSLWPAVIMHGLLVWLWQAVFAGPDIAQLMQP